VSLVLRCFRAETLHWHVLENNAELFERCAHRKIAGRADARDADFLAFEISAFGDGGIGEQGKDHLMGRGADPDEVGALNPSRQHWRRRQVAELNFAGEQGLHCSGTAANVDQVRVQAMFSKVTVFVSEPKRADAGGESAISGAYRG